MSEWTEPDTKERVERRVEMQTLKNDIADLKSEMHELQNSVKDLVAAWQTATGIVAFVKWLAGAVTAAGVLWAVFKHGVKGG